MLNKILFSFVCVVLLATGCQKTKSQPNITTSNNAIKNSHMTITSSVFEPNGSIPQKYSCEGEGVNPPLEFSDVPTGTKSLALLVDDPDVPKELLPSGVFDHWIVYNMPGDTKSISENSGDSTPGKQGKNGAGKLSYAAPCPPDREHRYFFKLFALDTELDLSEPTKAEVEQVMQGHIIAQAELIGKYEKQNK